MSGRKLLDPTTYIYFLSLPVSVPTLHCDNKVMEGRMFSTTLVFFFKSLSSSHKTNDSGKKFRFQLHWRRFMAMAMTEVFETVHPPGQGTVISSFRRDHKRRLSSVPLSNWRWEQIERSDRCGVLSLRRWTSPTFLSRLLFSILDTRCHKSVKPMKKSVTNSKYSYTNGGCGGAVVLGTALQVGRVRVIGFFHWHNPFGRNMALGSTQPLTEMSTRNISWGVNAAGA